MLGDESSQGDATVRGPGVTVDVDDHEALDHDADVCVCPALPPCADLLGIGGPVLETIRSERLFPSRT
jgi:hypothetical protein